MSTRGVVTLVDVDEPVLRRLVDAAVADASAADATPPLTPGDDWTRARIDWLRTFHRDRTGGLSGERHESTWAVVVDGAVVGSVRLAHTAEPGVLETGLWLTRGVRSGGVGTSVLGRVIDRARDAGAIAVCATTTADNPAARAVLRRLGFAVPPARDGVVNARFDLH